jgi:alanine racemase
MDPCWKSSRPNRMRIDTAAVTSNAGRVVELLGDQVKLIAALKANAYGHGLVVVGQAAVAAGAAGLAVGDLESAAQLRRAGLSVPIVVYPGVRWDEAALLAAAKLDLIVTLVDAGHALAVQARAQSAVQFLLKVDVGHSRLGVPAEQVAEVLAALRHRRMLSCVGILAHVYERPESSDQAIQGQLDRMTAALDALEATGPLPPYRIAVSTGPLSRYDVVRFDARLNYADPGRLLLGLVPPALAAKLRLRAALASLESELIQVRELPADPSPAAPYGSGAYRRIGVFPMGRADGLGLVHTGRVIVANSFAPVIGEWIEHTTVALADATPARAGDTVVIIGSHGGLSIGPQAVLRAHPELALADLASSVHPTVPRVAATPPVGVPGREVGTMTDGQAGRLTP